MSILSPLQHMWVLGSTHSFGSADAPSHASPLEDVAASVGLCVTALFPRICCSLQSANPEAIEKALHQVTCTHLSCESVPAAPQTAAAPARMQLLTAFIRPGWRQGNFSHCQARFWSLLCSTPASLTPQPCYKFLYYLYTLKLMTSVFQESPCDSPFPFNPPEGYCL